ncbi:hypothetical protein [Nitratireductor sp. L15S-10]|uniref:hypothetical protein n=1 Tax=Nitratireductor sp. L15S-10 TaxID=3034028 RepID=UPI0038573945
MSTMKVHFNRMVLAAFAAAMLTSTLARADDGPESEAAQARQVRIQRELERSRDMLEDQHQEWMRSQRDIPRLTTPGPLDLNVPIYTSPARLQ